MDLKLKLQKIKQQFDNNEIDENEYNKRKKLILKKWAKESKNIKQPECSRGKCQQKVYLFWLSYTFSAHLYNMIVANKSKETDLYAVLQLPSSATEAEIKLKYRQLALKHHPDKNGGVQTEEVYHQFFFSAPVRRKL